MLLTQFLSLLSLWRPAFRSRRSWVRALEQSLGLLTVPGAGTLTRVLATLGREHQDWSADYRLHSRADWEPARLFDALLPTALAHCPGPFVAVAIDDTRLKKWGKRIPFTSWQRDPLSPPFRYNLYWGVRVLQASLLLPLHRRHPVNTRAVPVRFEPAPVPKRPGARATPEAWQQYRQEQKQHNLSQQARTLLSGLRASLEQAGARHQTLLVVGDGSFCNRTLFREPIPGIDLRCRTRKNIVLCHPAAPGGRRVYSVETFTPEQVRQGEQPWASEWLWFGGQRRGVDYKEVNHVLWRTGAQRRRVRLLVLRPVPYHHTPQGRTHYRQPGYLLTTDLTTPAAQLLQAYLDRNEIEVNHRDEKSVLKVGDAQLWSQKGAPRQPAMAVAGYSALLLASLQAYGAERSAAYRLLPKWRNQPSARPSCLDLLTLLRAQWYDHPVTGQPVPKPVSYQHSVLSSAA